MNNTKPKIGIFAGTFDPVHDGHLSVAELAIEHLELDRLLFAVEKHPWTDKHPEPIEHREEMLRRATAASKRIDVLKLKNDRFTIEETLTEIEAKFKNSELYFIFGADIFLGMNKKTWPRLQSLLKHYLVVFERNKLTEIDITEHGKELGVVLAILPSEHKHHSSTDVRLRPHKKAVWVPEVVADYIDKHGLYKEADSMSE